MVRRVLLCAAALALGGACDAGFETPSIVLDLRVLGIRCDPPEVVLDVDPMDPDSFQNVDIPPVTVTALVADPATTDSFRWSMVACPPTSSLRCDDPSAPYVNIGAGRIDDPETIQSEEEGVTDSFVVLPTVLEESVRLDDVAGFGGIGVQIEIVIWPEQDGDDLSRAIYASKKILYSPRVPEERVANENPWIERIDRTIEDAEDTDPRTPVPFGRCGFAPPVPVAPEEVIRLEPVEPEGARETYVLPTFDGGVRTITENLRYSWFATAGELTAEQTGGPLDAFGNAPPLWTEWKAPQEAGEVAFWVVQRDERGGSSWIELCFEVTP
jgi:hypothetical protein